MDQELNKFMAWTIALRGLIAIIFGLILMFFKFDAAVFFITVFGMFFVIDGFFVVFESFTEKKAGDKRWYVQLIDGILKVLIGMFVLYFPVFSSLTYLVVIQIIVGVWALLTGLGSIAAGFSLAKGFLSTVLYIIIGIYLFIVGLSFVLNPITNVERFIFLVGLVIVSFGVINLGAALLLRNEKSVAVKK